MGRKKNDLRRAITPVVTGKIVCYYRHYSTKSMSNDSKMRCWLYNDEEKKKNEEASQDADGLIDSILCDQPTDCTRGCCHDGPPNGSNKNCGLYRRHFFFKSYKKNYAERITLTSTFVWWMRCGSSYSRVWCGHHTTDFARISEPFFQRDKTRLAYAHFFQPLCFDIQWL